MQFRKIDGKKQKKYAKILTGRQKWDIKVLI